MPEFHSDAAIEAGTDLTEFTQAYITALYWTDTGDNEQPNSEIEMSETARADAARDCAEFNKLARAYLDEIYATKMGYGEAQAGHDFWLTRNGHGCGFWDRGLDDLGDVLSNLAKKSGECHAYEGDDGLLYLY